MKSPVELTISVLTSVGMQCGVCTSLDKKTIESRSKMEGDSFVTITLSDFGKDLQKGLSQGSVGSHLFVGFRRGRGCLPAFLQGFTELIFDSNSGELLPDPSVDAIHAVFQVCFLTAKIKRDCSERNNARAFAKYLATEDSVRQADSRMEDDDYALFSEACRLLYWKPLDLVQKDLLNGVLMPRHGPGATAEKCSSNRKYAQSTWPARLEREFPALEFLLPNARYRDRLDDVRYLEPGSEIPVRVITVPKTLRTPRIIAIEPVAMQYTQQALMAPIVKYLEEDDFLNGMLGFTDQEPNQLMAREGSITGSLATLDLSEASDRVSNQLALRLFEKHRYLSDAVQACRSRKADVNGRVIRLSKFASMGSALCFPVEAMVFLAIVFIGIAEELGVPLDRHLILRWRSQVRVYGDDIIVPTHFAESVTRKLEHFGAQVNHDKSFWTGKFRESCGKEYYDGNDVSIVRCRSDFPTSRKCVTEVVSTVSLRNQMYYAGLWHTVEALDRAIEGVLPRFPIVLSTSVVLGRESVFSPVGEKDCEWLHVPLVKGYVLSATAPSDPLDDVGALTKFLLKKSDDPHCRGHLERAGRPKQPYLKLRWKAPF